MKRTTLVLTLAAAAMFAFTSCNKSNSGEAYFKLDAREDIPTINSSIGQTSDTTLKFESGTSLSIPSEAFVRKDGKAIEGMVNVKFQEFHTYSEIMASGAPMIFQEEDGRIGQMVSSAMFNLEASDASGAKLDVNPDKAIKVELACQAKFEGFDLFYLKNSDDVKENQAGFLQMTVTTGSNPDSRVRWERKERVTLKQNQNLKLDSVDLALQNLKQPVAPNKNQDNKMYFNVDIDLKKFPEFKSFHSLIWTLASDTVDEAVLNQKWASMDIEDSGLGYYNMTLTSKKETKTIAVVPVLEGAEYQKALADFESNIKSFDEEKGKLSRKKKAKANADAYIASFLINRTGYYNIDAVYHQLANLEPFAPEFVINNQEIKVKNFKLISYFNKAKSVVKYDQSNMDEFFYVKMFNNSILVEDINGHFYSISSKDFKKADLSLESPKLNLKPQALTSNSLSAYEQVMLDLMSSSM